MAASHPSWILFLSIISPMPGSTGPTCLWHIGCACRKVPFNDQHCCSFKMAATAPILDLVSVDYLTNGWVDWSDFFVAYWDSLEEGSLRWQVPPLIQYDRHGTHLGFHFRPLFHERLSRLVQFFYLIGGAGRFKCRRSFKMATTGAIFHLVSIYYLTNASVDWLSTSRMDTWHTAPPDFAISQHYNIQVGGGGAYATLGGIALVIWASQ
jgi:hypothetical protein